MTATLLTDIITCFKIKMGSKGDKVTVISEHDGVYIVKGKDTFSVRQQDLKIIQ